jgi:DNA-binding IclR family transcriptional regulator
MSAETEAYHVSRTTGALELLADGPHTASQAAEALGVHPRTARRILKRLAHDGYAVREDHVHGRYLLAPRFIDLATRAIHHRQDDEIT